MVRILCSFIVLMLLPGLAMAAVEGQDGTVLKRADGAVQVVIKADILNELYF
jgi:hypothetical protein